MKKLVSTIAIPLLLVSFCLNAQNAEKTLVKAFNLQGNHNVLFDVDGQVDVQTWTQEEMRVMITINLPKGSDIMLKNLVKVGRYNLIAEEFEGTLKVVAPGLDRQVKLRNGTELEELISMVVYVPEEVNVSTTFGDTVFKNEENE